MNTYPSYYTNTYSTSSSSSYNSSSTHQKHKNGKQTAAAFRSPLRSVRKSVITKKPIAPLPPTPPKIYKVDPVDFMDVVQKLTGSPEFIPTRLQEMAPPPVSLSPPHRRNPIVHPSSRREKEEKQMEQMKTFDSIFEGLSPMGFSLSPASVAWFSSNLLSPGTLSSMETSAVLL